MNVQTDVSVASRSAPMVVWPSFSSRLRDDRRQVRVSTALAVAVHAALDVRGAGLDRRERVGNRHVRVVVGVDANHPVEPLSDLGDELGHARGRAPAVGVAEAQDVGARAMRRLERAERVVGVGAVPVEEVLGVVDHFLPVVLQMPDGLGNQDEVLVERDLERPQHVKVPGLAEDRDRGRASFDKGGNARVLVHTVFGEPGRAERGEPRMPERQLASACEELAVLRVRPGPASLDVVNAERVQLLRNDELVVHRERHGLTLRAVAKRGVERENSHKWLCRRTEGPSFAPKTVPHLSDWRHPGQVFKAAAARGRTFEPLNRYAHQSR